MSIGQGIALLIVPLYALDLGGSPASAAVIFACRGLGNMIADLPAGYAAQRFGDAYVMKAGVVLMIIAALGAAMANSLPQLGVFTAVIGVSMATWLLARLTLISDRVSTEFRGQALSGLAGLQRVGNFLGPILGGYLAYIANYQLAFALIACLAGITLLLVLTYSTDAPSKVERSPGLAGTAETQVEHSRRSITALLGEYRLIFMTAGCVVFLLTLLRAARTLLLPLWGAHLGLNAAEIGFVVGLAAALDMMMFPLAGLIMDHQGRRISAGACLSLLSAGIVAIALSSNTLVFTLAACLAGLGNGIGSGINMTLGTDFAPADRRGSFLGIWRFIGDSGSFVGPSLISALTSALGLVSSMWVSAVLGVFGLMILLGFVPETLRQTDRKTRG